MTSWKRPRWFSLVSVGVFEVFIHLAEKKIAVTHFSCAPYRGMALDVMKPDSFKTTGKFVAMLFGFGFFLISSCHTWKISSDAVKFLLHAVFAPGWNCPLHQYPPLPSSYPPHQSNLCLQGQEMFIGKTAATAAYFIEYLNLLWRYIHRIITMTSCVYNSTVQASWSVK